MLYSGVPLCQVWKQTRTRYVSISSVVTAVEGELCKCLIGMHDFTGCDTASSLTGRGKITALRLVKHQTSCQEMFKQLGMEWILSDMPFPSLQAFTFKLYCSKPGTDNINDLRYRLFCAKKGNIDSTQLPPCVGCLFKHPFQAVIWKQSCQETTILTGSGWRKGGDHFATDWMSGDPAPTAVLELLSCACTRSCQLTTCSFLANGLKWTYVCKLLDCDNRFEDSTEGFVSDNSDEEEEI